MKTIKLTSVLLIFLSINFSVVSQEVKTPNDKKTKKIEIQTSAQCKKCKDRIEKDMSFVKGVKSVDLDLETKVLTIEYRTDKTNPEKLKQAVSKIGYDADDLVADPKAYAKLPGCCQKGGHDNNK